MNRFLLVLLIIIMALPLISQTTKIIVGGDYNYPPYSFIDKNGEANGYDVDVIKAIANELNIQVDFNFSHWDTTLQNLKTGKVDIITSIVYAESRERIFDFTFPLHTEYYAIFANDTSNINDLHDLKGKIPAFLQGDISNESFLEPMGLLSSKYVSISSLPEAFHMISIGKCDYVIAPYPLGMEMIEDNKYSDIAVKGPSIIPSVYCLAVKQGDSELLSLFNKGIEVLSRNGKLDEIYNKWIKYKREDDQYKRSFTFAKYIIAILGVIALLLLISGQILHRMYLQKKRRIRNTEAIYKKVFNSVADALILVDKNGFVLDVNEKALNLYELDFSEMVGKKAEQFVSSQNKILLDQVICQVQKRDVFKFEKIEKLSGGKIVYLDVNAVNVDLEAGRGCLFVLHDITEEQNIVKTLNEAKIEAESANRTKTTFLATVSHEIRTPLNAIIGFSNLMTNTKLDSRQEDYNRKVLSSSEILLNLVSDVLDLTKIEAGKLELEESPFLVKDLVSKLIDVQRIKTEAKGIDLDLIISDNTPDTLVGDSLRLSQVLLNFINNAIKFTDKGGVILIVRSGKEYEQDNDTICRMWFIVKDTGIGIPPDKQDKLFMPFTQSDNSDSRKYGGTGLGLSISKNLVELMGGNIFVESTAGKGARFSFFVDLKKRFDINSKQIEHINEEVIEKNCLSDIIVLLVEDNEFNSEIYIEQLEGLGAKVIWASNGHKALDLLVEETVDVILMDIEMPGLNGIETAKRIKQFKRWENIPIISMSAYGMPDEREKALAAGMVTYLCKPVPLKKLSSAILKYTRHMGVVNEAESNNYARNEALLNFGGDEQMYNRALLRFARAYKDIPKRIEEYLLNEDYLQIKTIAHNLKNAAGTIGYESLANKAQEIDATLKVDKYIEQHEINILIDLLNEALIQL